MRERDELERFDGATGVNIASESGATEILYDVDILAEKRVEKAIRDRGYEIE